MKTFAVAAILCCCPLAFADDESGTAIGFAGAKAGFLPKGWAVAKTGKGSGGDWQLVADKDARGGLALAQVKGDKTATFNLCVLEGSHHKDIDMRVSLKASAGEVDQGGGLVWRLLDGDNYYIARMNPLENNFRVYKVEKGKRKQLATADLPLETGKWYVLRIVHEGRYIDCFLNNKKWLTAEDETFPEAGKIGFWTKADAQTRFAGLTIANRKVKIDINNPMENSKDEPLAGKFSMASAARFMDNAALTWQKQKNCFSCHTNYPYLYARPAISSKVAAHAEIRKAAEDMVTEGWVKEKPHSDAEVVAAAAALAFNDAQTTGKLQPVTGIALKRMWALQKKDGSWNWVKCGWAPMEYDEHYGVTLAAIAVGAAPDKYVQTAAAQKGLEGIRRFLKDHRPDNLHQRAMLLWASSFIPDLMDAAAKKTCIHDLLALQRPDGGWAAASLGNWPRGDGKMQDKETSDGYGTGFVLYVLRRGGVPAADPALQKGAAWLKDNQRLSGRWFARSLFRDNKHYLSHAGTAFAVMALAACEDKK